MLVVGAGIAGLAAAQDLQANDFKVTVLEGRKRIGGRVWTDRSLGHPVDLGAAWIDGARNNPIAKLARNFAIKTHSSNFESFVFYDHNMKRVNNKDVERLWVISEKWRKKARRLNRKLVRDGKKDISLARAMELVTKNETLSDTERRIVAWATAWAIEASEADDLKHLSLRGQFAEDEPDSFKGASLLFPDGYGQIPVRLAKGLDIKLEHVVTRITYDNKGVTVTTDQGTFQANRVIITLPLGVLKKGAIKFEPALPETKLQAIQRLGMGVANKIALRFEKTFWPEDRDFLYFAGKKGGEFVGWVNMKRYTPAPILVLWNHGDHARAVESLSMNDRKARAMEVIRGIFGTNIPAPKGAVVTRWMSDPFTRGSYSNLAVGSSYDDFDALAEPVENRLFFAGEATSRRHSATVHGAFITGIREALRVRKLKD